MMLGAKLSLLVISSVVCLLSILLHFHFRRVRKSFLWISLCCCGAILAYLSSILFFDLRLSSMQDRIGEETLVEGVVLERGTSLPYLTQFQVEIETVNGERERFGALVECAYASSLQVGDRFRMRVIPRAFSQEELFDERTYRLSDGCLTVLTCASNKDSELIGDSNDLRVLASKLNTCLSYRLYQAVGEDAGALSAALLLGNRRFLTDDTTLNFRRSGVSHLLALSGLHVAILISFFEFLMRAFRIPKRMRAFLIPAVALSYLALTGFSVSTQRAVLMVCLLYLAYLLGESYDSFTVLSLALVLILLLTPYAILDLSLWMSFLSAASIIVFSPGVYHLCLRMKLCLPAWMHKAVAALISAFATGFFASSALLLLSAAVFGETSLLAIPATMLLSLPITALLILSMAALCLPFLGDLAKWVGDLILQIVSFGSEMPDVLLPTGDPYTKAALAALTTLMILMAIGKIERPSRLLLQFSLFLFAICVSLCVTYLPQQHDWKVDCIKAGHGELRLYTKYAEAVLINDTRGAASGDYEIRSIALQRRCSEIDDMVLSRYYNQATYFLSSVSGTVKVRRLHLPKPTTEREEAIAKRLKSEAELHGIQVDYDAALWLDAYERE